MSNSPYVNPLQGAKVTPERIDMGVDYAGSGPVRAIGDAIITGVADLSRTAWQGWWVQYKLLGGPYKGQTIYVAEGVNPLVKQGQHVGAGTPVAQIVHGSSTGIETGFGSGTIGQTYAQAFGGGYSEGQLTAAGKAFSDFIKALGGPAGTVEGRKVTGTFKGADLGNLLGGGGVVGGAAGDAANAFPTPDEIAKSLIGGIVSALGKDGLKIVLTIGLVLAGVTVAGLGTARLSGARVQPEDVAKLATATKGKGPPTP